MQWNRGVGAACHNSQITFLLEYCSFSTHKFTFESRNEVRISNEVCIIWLSAYDINAILQLNFLVHTQNIMLIRYPSLQVVKIQDGCGSSYKVALNSGLEFGIMYNPNKNREEALVSNGCKCTQCTAVSRGQAPMYLISRGQCSSFYTNVWKLYPG